MEILLVRTYNPYGTNGDLFVNNRLLCHTIERPWQNNTPQESCIPEGRYPLSQRTNLHFQHHLLVSGVPGRSDILIHPANDALSELKGCIAPVSKLTGAGRGSESRKALNALLQATAGAFHLGQPVTLRIIPCATTSAFTLNSMDLHA